MGVEFWKWRLKELRVCDSSIVSRCSDAGKWGLFLAWTPFGMRGSGHKGKCGWKTFQLWLRVSLACALTFTTLPDAAGTKPLL